VPVVINQNRVSMRPVVLGKDFGNTVEVLSGLDEHSAIVSNPPDSLVDQEVVRIIQPSKTKESEE